MKATNKRWSTYHQGLVTSLLTTRQGHDRGQCTGQGHGRGQSMSLFVEFHFTGHRHCLPADHRQLNTCQWSPLNLLVPALHPWSRNCQCTHTRADGSSQDGLLQAATAQFTSLLYTDLGPYAESMLESRVQPQAKIFWVLHRKVSKNVLDSDTSIVSAYGTYTGILKQLSLVEPSGFQST